MWSFEILSVVLYSHSPLFFFSFYCNLQFFSSKKKRKILSPDAKSGRPEKGAKNQIEGSPSAKGSLECYLETSKDGISPAKSLNSISDQKARQVPIKRNLILETGLSRDENEDVPHGQPQSREASGVVQRLKLEQLSDIGSVATKGIHKDSSKTESLAQNSELKEFATGFLSLYCRYYFSSF